MTATEATLGIVVIGRNEGDRLKRCLASVEQVDVPTCYVDSGSTDGSSDLARSFGVLVHDLDPAHRFTAARARNMGFSDLVSAYPSLEFVQVLDGDTELSDGWIDVALAALRADRSLGAVFGRRRERFPESSRYNALCDMEWNKPIGTASAFGGDAMIRVAAWNEAGGYDETLIAGEDPEFSHRIINAGHRVECLDHEMTMHDAAIMTFGQWFTRTRRSGHAYVEGASLHRSTGHNRSQVRSIVAWAGILPTLIVGSLIVGTKFRWLRLGGLGILGYPTLWWRVRKYRTSLDDSGSDAGLYASSVVIGKFAQLVGMLEFFRGKVTGDRAQIIEYKTSSSTDSASR